MELRHVVEMGEGPPVLFLHGWSARGDFFAPQLALAENGRRIIVPDLPGHGRDRRPGAALTIADLADAVDRYLATHDLTGLTLVGWSMGAMVAFERIARHGTARIARLVIVDMSPRIVNDVGWDLGLSSGLDSEGAEAAADAMARDWPRYARRIVPSLFDPDLAGDDPLRAAADAAIADNDGDTLASLWRSLARADHRAALRAIDVPALVIAGARSQLYRPAVGQWLADHLPDGRSVVIRRAGHTPQLEQPEAFNAAIRDFVGA